MDGPINKYRGDEVRGERKETEFGRQYETKEREDEEEEKKGERWSRLPTVEGIMDLGGQMSTVV